MPGPGNPLGGGPPPPPPSNREKNAALASQLAKSVCKKLWHQLQRLFTLNKEDDYISTIPFYHHSSSGCYGNKATCIWRSSEQHIRISPLFAAVYKQGDLSWQHTFLVSTNSEIDIVLTWQIQRGKCCPLGGFCLGIRVLRRSAGGVGTFIRMWYVLLAMCMRE